MKRLFVTGSGSLDQLINYQMPYYIIIDITKISVTWAVSMLHEKNKELKIRFSVLVLCSQGQNHNAIF